MVARVAFCYRGGSLELEVPMPQPVKLPDALIGEARDAARREHRSLAGQIEHWAELGRALEADLRGGELRAALDRADRPVAGASDGVRVAAVFVNALSDASRDAFARELAHRTIYGSDPAFPGWLVRFEPDGTCTPGRLVNREFVPAEALQSERHAAG
jgi:ParD-like antitoxin of type II bacterial toxin-antitoxin system